MPMRYRTVFLLIGGLALHACAGPGVPVWAQDPTTGCWSQQTVHWPREYWGELADGACGDTDLDRYFTRDGVCYSVNGVCTEWMNDPEITLCEQNDDACCSVDAVCTE